MAAGDIEALILADRAVISNIDWLASSASQCQLQEDELRKQAEDIIFVSVMAALQLLDHYRLLVPDWTEALAGFA